MRRIFTVLMMALLLVPDVSARGKNDWKNVEKLKPGTEVMIVMSDGRYTVGRVKSVAGSELEILTPDGRYPAVGWDHSLNRTDIEKIVRVGGRDPFMPDPKFVLTLTVAGGLMMGATVGAIHDQEHGNRARWLADGLGGAGIGMFAWMAFYLGVSVFDLATLAHHRTVIYEDAGLRTLTEP